MNRDRLVEVFLELVAIDATSDRERPVAEYIRGFLEPLGVKVREDRAGQIRGGNSGNLVCRSGSGGTLLLTAHMDTARSTADLRPVVSSDRITSDGSTILGADNRAGVAVILHALEQLLRDEGRSIDLTVAFTICEEVDLTGSRELEIPDTIECACVMDSSYRPGQFIYRSFGACRWRAEIQGRAAHAGLAPEEGINALWIASRAVAGLQLGRLEADTVANVGRMRGGDAINIVPDQAVVEGEIRSLVEGRIEQQVALVRQSFEDSCGPAGGKLDFEVFMDFRPYVLAEDAAVCRRLSRVLRSVGLKPEPRTSAGGSDANSLNAKGLEAVNVGIGAQNPHAHDEFILLEDLVKAAEIARGLMLLPELPR